MGLVAVALAALGADQLTKSIVSDHLSLDEGLHVAGPFSIHHVQNSGIAFGLFSSATAAVIVLTSVAVAWMLVFFARSGSRHPILPAALGLVIGGSVSNLIDRVRLGHVTDFLDLRYWPAFNLADSFIVVGVITLFVVLLFTDRGAAPAAHHKRFAYRFLTTRRGRGSTASSPFSRRWARVPRRRGCSPRVRSRWTARGERRATSSREGRRSKPTRRSSRPRS